LRSPVLLAVTVFAATIAVQVDSASVARSASSDAPSDLVWLALGDSYSSGEGLRYNDSEANPPDKNCERATGRSTVNGGSGSRAYSRVAYDDLDGGGKGWGFALLACTGARSNELAAQYEEWLAGDRRTADMVTMSMGGNNLGFSDVVMACVGISVEGAMNAAVGLANPWLLNPALGCETSESELRARIDQLVGDSHVGPDGGQTLPDMYRELVKRAVTPGGHVVVLGYPNLVEESGRWARWLFEGNRCNRIRRADASMLRSVTGYLNQQLALMVDRLNEDESLHATFHWIDVSQIYEGSDGRHGLCTGDPWINGVTVGLAGPDVGRVPVRIYRSFHPNQRGHDAVGHALAATVADLDWSALERATTVAAATTPEQAFAIASARDPSRFAGVTLGPELGGIADARLFPLLRDGAAVGGITLVANPYWEVDEVYGSIEEACVDAEPWMGLRTPSYAEFCGRGSDVIDPTTTYALVHVDLSTHTLRLMQWVYAEDVEDFIVGEEFEVALDPSCTVTAVDGSSRTLERLAEFVNNYGGTDIPPVFQLTPGPSGQVVAIREVA
jgi:hypothetical protein